MSAYGASLYAVCEFLDRFILILPKGIESKFFVEQCFSETLLKKY